MPEKSKLITDSCDVTKLVEQFGSSLYILDEKTLRTSASQYRTAFEEYYAGESQVIYASKAWNCIAIVNILASEGNGVLLACHSQN